MYYQFTIIPTATHHTVAMKKLPSIVNSLAPIEAQMSSVNTLVGSYGVNLTKLEGSKSFISYCTTVVRLSDMVVVQAKTFTVPDTHLDKIPEKLKQALSLDTLTETEAEALIDSVNYLVNRCCSN